ncbi:MAG: histidine ammonia-lyase [Planctomycetes bacterium]|nr:histidine ammonia-lyase [Planctomycetota bacterium]
MPRPFPETRTPPNPVHHLPLDGTSLTLEALLPLAQGEPCEIQVSEDVYAGLQASRDMVDACLERGDAVYGISTGFGKLKNKAIAPGDLAELQRNLVLSHSVGMGEPLSVAEVRIAQVLRLNSLLRGVSGIRIELARRLVECFNLGFVPEVPGQGSVGDSGDLAPLSHMVAAYMGFGFVHLNGRRLPAGDALKELNLEPLELAAKEGLALINGTEVMKAIATVNVLRARNLSKAADAITSLTLEAKFGSIYPYQERLAELKANAGQSRTAANVRACLQGSQVLESHADCDRVQDPYSLRCVPQIHGAFKTALEHVDAVLQAELNAVTDNPIVDPETGSVYSAGLFHGLPLSVSQDYLALSLCTLANVSERRIEQLVNPDLSGLPAFLTPIPGLHSGFMITQYTAAALASENKPLAHPASADTVPTSANQEDHVSMGMTAVRKVRSILDNTEKILAIELLCAAQAREFHPELKAGKGAEAAHAHLRTRVEPLREDRYLAPDLETAHQLLADGSLVAAVETAAGPLVA